VAHNRLFPYRDGGDVDTQIVESEVLDDRVQGGVHADAARHQRPNQTPHAEIPAVCENESTPRSTHTYTPSEKNVAAFSKRNHDAHVHVMSIDAPVAGHGPHTFEGQHQRHAFVSSFEINTFLRQFVSGGVGVLLGQLKVHDGHVGAEPTTQINVT
jgi:hypothetical protein